MKDYRVPQLGATSPTSELRLRPALRYAIRYRGQIFPIQGSQATLGRNLDCDIVLSGPLVSRLHARLVIDADGVQVEDLLSRNGVAVDGVLIDRPRRIEPGARIRLGDEALELVGERIDRGPRVPTLNQAPPGSSSGGFVSAGLSSSLPPPTSWHPSSGPSNSEYPSAPANAKESDRPSGHMLARESERPSGHNRLSESQRTLPLEEYDELTHRADLFDLLGSAVERAFAVNNGEEVVRLIGRHLERIVDQARTERHPND
ncbi:MAG TPA: FHA domain-containing protein, partial [Polyangiaceae bacterium]